APPARGAAVRAPRAPLRSRVRTSCSPFRSSTCSRRRSRDTIPSLLTARARSASGTSVELTPRRLTQKGELPGSDAASPPDSPAFAAGAYRHRRHGPHGDHGGRRDGDAPSRVHRLALDAAPPRLGRDQVAREPLLAVLDLLGRPRGRRGTC